MVTTAGVTYTYDGDGRRVKKTDYGTCPPNCAKLYWYGLNGEVLAESDTNGTILYEYIYFNGKRIARRTPSGTVHYYLADRLAEGEGEKPVPRVGGQGTGPKPLTADVTLLGTATGTAWRHTPPF